MMDDDGNICDVGDFLPEFKRYIVSKPITTRLHFFCHSYEIEYEYF